MRIATGCCLSNGLAQAVSKSIGQGSITTKPIIGWGHRQPTPVIPILGELNSLGFVVAYGIGQVLEKEPTPMIVDDADLVIAQSVYMIFVDQEAGIINEQLPHLIHPIRKHKAPLPNPGR